MDNKDKIKASAAAKDSREMTDDYVQVFQPILPDDWQTYDQKLNSAVERMVNDTIGDLPVHSSVLKTTSHIDSKNSSKNNSKKNSKNDTKNISKNNQKNNQKNNSKTGSNAKGQTTPNSGNSKSSSNGKKNGRKMTGLKLFLILLLAAVLILAVGYVYYANYYSTRFAKGTFINGMAVDDMTVDDVITIISNHIEQYVVDITYRDGQSEHIDGSDIGYHFEPENKVQELLDAQNEWLWFLGVFGTTTHDTIDASIAFDEDRLKELVFSSEEFDKVNQEAPENAHLKIKNEAFVIEPETAGNEIDTDLFTELVMTAVKGGETEIIADQPGIYRTAAILSDDKDLKNQCDDLNAFLDTKVTYDLIDNKKKVLDRKDTIAWVTQADDGYYYINTDDLRNHIIDYVKGLADSVDYTKTARPFNSTLRGSLEVACSTYGTIVDQALEVEALFTNLIERRTEEREPVYSRNDGTIDPSFGGHYIEVDVSNQHVYLYKNGSLVVDTPCVTGCVAYDTQTPKGVYSLYNKEKNRTLRGEMQEDGTFAYETPVKYWMPFLRGYGLHDANWRGDFGGSIYVDGGSHGCVNLPEDIAAVIYDNSEVGTPVIVF